MYFINTDVDAPERYDLSKFFEYTDNFDPITSDIIVNVKKLPLGGKYKVTSEMGRPDQLSYFIYNGYQYWWIIMLYNDLVDISEVKAGMMINYPDQNDLEDYYFNLKRRKKLSER